MDLERMQIIRLRGARGVRLACRGGSLWVTQEGVARDDFLMPGVSQVIETNGMVVVQALLPSSLTIDSGKSSAVAVTVGLEPRTA